MNIEARTNLFSYFFAVKLGSDAFYITTREKNMLIGEISSKVKNWKPVVLYI